MTWSVHTVTPGDESMFERVAEGTFDHDIDAGSLRRFLDDANHHMCAAVEDAVIIGFASAVSYLHPDKPLQFWINEVGVAPAHRQRGVGASVVRAMLDVARSLGCKEVWLATEGDNTPARALYNAVGGEETTDIVVSTFKLRDS